MQKSLWLAGFPSLLGGGDTECLHQIDLWRAHDISVNLVPMFGLDDQTKKHCTDIGCHIHEYHSSIFAGKLVVSFCNGNFLEHLPEIIENGKPRCIVWFNCMTNVFPLEAEAIRHGWIDLHGFVSNYQRNILKPQLETYGKVNEFEGYSPYFNPDNALQSLKFKYQTPSQWFSVGRISRDDMTKFPADLWNIFYKICTPQRKKILVLGFGENAMKKCGLPPKNMDCQIFKPNSIPVKSIYELLHCIIHKTGGSRESYCRIVPEAYASGIPMIVEKDYAFPDLVENGVTGFLCDSSDEMSFRASELAFDEPRRKKMVFAARDFLLNDIASDEKCWRPWKVLLQEIYGH